MKMDLELFHYHTLVFLKRSCEKYNWDNVLGWIRKDLSLQLLFCLLKTGDVSQLFAYSTSNTTTAIKDSKLSLLSAVARTWLTI